MSRIYNLKSAPSPTTTWTLRAPLAPNQIEGLQVWYKSDTEVYQDSGFTTLATANTDPVGGWKDQSGYGRDVTQVTAGKRPTLTTGALNGYPAITFGAVGSYLSGGNLSALDFERTDPFTAFAVVKVNSTSGDQVILGKSISTPDYKGWQLRLATALQGRVFLHGANTAIFARTDLTLSTSSYYTLFTTSNGNSLLSGTTYWFNGASRTLTPELNNLNQSMKSSGDFIMGGFSDTNLDTFYGNIVECGVYNRLLPNDTLYQLSRHLNRKYSHYV